MLTKEDLEQFEQILDAKLDVKFEENNKNLVTREYFDERVGELVTFKQMGAQMAILDKGLKAHAEALQEELAQMVGEGFVDVISRLDVRERVKKLEELLGVQTPQT